MVAAIQDDVLGSIDLSRERDELRERCEALEHKFFDAEKELAKLRVYADVVNSLQENVDQYGRRLRAFLFFFFVLFFPVRFGRPFVSRFVTNIFIYVFQL